MKRVLIYLAVLIVAIIIGSLAGILLSKLGFIPYAIGYSSALIECVFIFACIIILESK